MDSATRGGRTVGWARHARLSLTVIGAGYLLFWSGTMGGQAEVLRLAEARRADVPVPRVLLLAPTDGAQEVGTHDLIRVAFTEPVQRTSAPVIIDPPVAYSTSWDDAAVRVFPERLAPGTTYELRISPALEGVGGAKVEAVPPIHFTVRSAPRVVGMQPEQQPLPINGTVRITFDRPMDGSAVEQDFRLEPAATGRFEWPDPQTLVFRAERLRWSTDYTLQLAGTSEDGDALLPFEAQFKTVEPPPPAVAPGCGILYSLGPQFTLTFDDWGTREQVDVILRALADGQVRAYFFPVGWWAAQNSDLIARMRAEGHVVGNHTYSHPFLARLSAPRAESEIAGGVSGSGLFRPPYGSRNAFVDGLACRLGYKTVLWTVDPSDYLCQPAQVIANKVIAAARPGGIAVLHMKGCSTGQALPRMIQGLRARALL